MIVWPSRAQGKLAWSREIRLQRHLIRAACFSAAVSKFAEGSGALVVCSCLCHFQRTSE